MSTKFKLSRPAFGGAPLKIAILIISFGGLSGLMTGTLGAKADQSQYNLMSIIKIVHDGFHKYWKKENGVITPSLTRGPRDFYPIAIHLQPPEEYDFLVNVDCDEKTPPLLILVCPTSKGTVDFKIDGDGASFIGGDNLPHEAKAGLLSKGSHHLTVKVRQTSIQGFVDDAKVVSFETAGHPLNKPDALTKGFEDKELGVAAGPGISVIRELRLDEFRPHATSVQNNPRSPRMNRGNGNPPPEPDPYAGAAAPTDVVPGSTTKLSEIRGLVVMQAPDGAFHGKAIDIIATTWKTTQKGFTVTPLGTMGREMRISLEEAKRILSIHHPDLSGRTIQISFGDKYSPMDGGSAGTAFSILLLSAAGDFEIDPNAALTGDITVDAKIRTVGEVPAKVHGAALDKCKVVSIPLSNVSDMDDALLLQGASTMWETQILSADTLDAAIANVRKDRTPKMLAALKLFDELKTAYGDKPPTALADTAARDKLKKILELAPNHVSAMNLLRLAQGKGPTHLTLVGSVERALSAIAPCQMSLFMSAYDPQMATSSITTSEQEALAKIQKIADPSALPFLTALDRFISAYRDWAAKASGRNKANPELKQLNIRADAARAELTKLATNSEVIDSMLHK